MKRDPSVVPITIATSSRGWSAPEAGGNLKEVLFIARQVGLID
jgi:hypothetical protein